MRYTFCINSLWTPVVMWCVWRRGSRSPRKNVKSKHSSRQVTRPRHSHSLLECWWSRTVWNLSVYHSLLSLIISFPVIVSFKDTEEEEEMICLADPSRFITDPDFCYQEFARKEEDHFQVFRVQVSVFIAVNVSVWLCVLLFFLFLLGFWLAGWCLLKTLAQFYYSQPLKCICATVWSTLRCW